LGKKDEQAEGTLMRTLVGIRSLLFAVVLMVISGASFAQIGISVSFGPPAFPVYEQPYAPGEGYIWTPGYWAWDGNDYYWVPGTWVLAPEPGFFWTPGYWGWAGNGYYFHEGYWGPHVGFYGGINYGFGYFGHGYEGGRWENNHFYYNTSVSRVNTTIIHNTYNTKIENVTVNRVSYNGGKGGVEARPTSTEETYGRERHSGPIAAQIEHTQAARSNPQLRASANQGRPPIAATSRPGDFKGEVVPAREAGSPYKAPEHATAVNENRPPNAGEAHANVNNHASELQSHHYTVPGTGNADTDTKYQQKEEKLAAKQNQEHQKVQQQQEKEHQQMEKKNADEAQRQQMEQRHGQQTQQLEQKHASQQARVQAYQQPHQSSAQSHPPEKH
jgi:WXXGXW repeat (2 copies)